MNRLIEDTREELDQLCERFKVGRLELFGSAADGSFDPQSSDLDFLVEFLLLQPGEHYDAYFGLFDALQELFQRRIDLVEASAMRNPCFMKRVNESRTSVDAARS